MEILSDFNLIEIVTIYVKIFKIGKPPAIDKDLLSLIFARKYRVSYTCEMLKCTGDS
jgi:hypothetical protein